MSVDTRQPDYRPGDWLTQCAVHPYTFWSSDTFIDAEGKRRCNKFCGQYEQRTEREVDQANAQARLQHEAPAPPRTNPRPKSALYEVPWGRWKMQGHADRLEDAANWHDGLPSPNQATVVDGRLGSKAFRFDGTDAYQVLGSEDAQAGDGGTVSICAWVKATTPGVILSKGDGNTGIVFKTFGTTFGYVMGGIGLNAGGLSESIVGDWHHLVFSTAENDVSGPFALYLDGVVVGTLAPFVDPVWINNTDPIRIGDGIAADVYDVRYYRRPITAAEVLSIMSGA